MNLRNLISVSSALLSPATVIVDDFEKNLELGSQW